MINFDLPLFMSDYVHRAGRVGRVSSKTNGLVTSFVTHMWDVDLLWKIEVRITHFCNFVILLIVYAYY